MAWLNRAKLYNPETKRWYCLSCDKRTKIERNPEWVADGSPMSWDGKDYEYITRCADCKHEHYVSSYACPNCGCSVGEQEPIVITKAVYNSYYSYEFGVTGYDWEEQHQCRKCRTKHWISNSSC